MIGKCVNKIDMSQDVNDNVKEIDNSKNIDAVCKECGQKLVLNKFVVEKKRKFVCPICKVEQDYIEDEDNKNNTQDDITNDLSKQIAEKEKLLKKLKKERIDLEYKYIYTKEKLKELKQREWEANKLYKPVNYGINLLIILYFIYIIFFL